MLDVAPAALLGLQGQGCLWYGHQRLWIFPYVKRQETAVARSLAEVRLWSEDASLHSLLVLTFPGPLLLCVKGWETVALSCRHLNPNPYLGDMVLAWHF